MRKKSRNLCRHGVVGKNDWFWQSKVSFGKRRTNDLIVSMCVACYNKEADNFEFSSVFEREKAGKIIRKP